MWQEALRCSCVWLEHSGNSTGVVWWKIAGTAQNFFDLAAMASATESDSSQDEESLSSADADLWALLPRKFRADFGSEGGQLPDVGLLVFLFADRHDLCAVMTDYVPRDRKLRTTAVRAFTALQQRALPSAQRRNRRGRTDPAWQKVALARRLAPADDSAGALDTVSWLFKHSGARRRQSAWPTRAAKKLADSKLGLTRAAIEKAGAISWLSFFRKLRLLWPNKLSWHPIRNVLHHLHMTIQKDGLRPLLYLHLA